MPWFVSSVAASLVAWVAEHFLEGRVSGSVEAAVSLVLWVAVFIPTYAWVKRLRDGI